MAIDDKPQKAYIQETIPWNENGEELGRIDVYSDGRRIFRDHSGTIRANEVPKELAQAWAKRGGASASQKASNALELIEEAGFTEDNCPAHLKLLAKQAATSHWALRDFRKLTSQEAPAVPESTYEDTGVYQLPPRGQRCPRCGQYAQLSREQLEITDQLIDILLAEKMSRQLAGENEGGSQSRARGDAASRVGSTDGD